MRILIVTDSYPPEVRSAAQLMAELADGLREHGHQITVATTVPGYNLAPGTKVKKIPREETVNGVRVFRVKTLPHHRVNYLFRGVSQLLLPRMFARAVGRVASGPFDFVIVHSPPLPLALAASRLAKRYGAKFIANVHDIFPQNGIDLVVAWQRPLIRLFFSPMERRVYAASDTIVVPSENHARYLQEQRDVPSEKLSVIPHWIDVAPYDAARATGKFRKQWKLEDTFVFFFGGVLGPSQGLDIVLEAAEAFREIPDVRFLFVGDGTARPRLERIVREKKLKNVVFKPFVSADEYPALVKEADACIATLTSRNTTPAVPAKLMGYLAAGKPVVLAVHRESDALRIVSEAHCGFTAISDDRDAVLAAFRSAYDTFTSAKFAKAVHASLRDLGENGRRYLDEHFSKEQLVARWDELLRAVR